MLVVLQAQASSPAPLQAAATVQATRTTEPPALDGSDSDPVWAGATPVDRFYEARPSEGAEPNRYIVVSPD